MQKVKQQLRFKVDLVETPKRIYIDVQNNNEQNVNNLVSVDDVYIVVLNFVN